MKPGAVPWWSLLVAAVVTVTWLWTHYEWVTFEEPEGRQMMRPQIEKEARRVGRLAYQLQLGDLQPNDVVRYQFARTRGIQTSRVIALEGQRVRIVGGKVYVDGKLIDDPYARGKADGDHLPEMLVPAGCVFVLNDVRTRGGDRWDSRNFGPIPFRCISHRFGPKEVQAVHRGIGQ